MDAVAEEVIPTDEFGLVCLELKLKEWKATQPIISLSEHAYVTYCKVGLPLLERKRQGIFGCRGMKIGVSFCQASWAQSETSSPFRSST